MRESQARRHGTRDNILSLMGLAAFVLRTEARNDFLHKDLIAIYRISRYTAATLDIHACAHKSLLDHMQLLSELTVVVHA